MRTLLLLSLSWTLLNIDCDWMYRGRYDYPWSTIYICNDIPEWRKWYTIYHEIGHLYHAKKLSEDFIKSTPVEREEFAYKFAIKACRKFKDCPWLKLD